MAQKEVWIGSEGPYLFDDTDTYPNEPSGPTITGLRTDTIIEVSNVATTNLTNNVRLVVSNSSKQVEEVNDLTQWIAGAEGVKVIDNGDGTVTIKLQQSATRITDADSPYTISDEYFIIVDSSGNDVDINLPALSSALPLKHIIKRKDNSANNIEIFADGTETIEGSSSVTLVNKYDYIILYPDTDEWLILGGS